MASPAIRWEDPVEPVRTLRMAGERERRIAEFRAKVREVGERWTGTGPAELTELLCAAADGDPELARPAGAGARLLEEFVAGLSRNVAVVSGDLAADLIDGRQLPHDVLDRLAPVYTAVVTRAIGVRRAGEGLDLAGHGVLRTRRSDVHVLLVPDDDDALLERITGELVDVEGWVATAKGAVTRLAEACAEASAVLRLVVAGCRPCGVYGMTDVLVERAIVRNDFLVARLAELIRPLRDNQALWATLVALVRTDFNRTQAARDLFIHRSTMDYRLQRIAKVTGCDPVSERGGQLLSAALVADAVA